MASRAEVNARISRETAAQRGDALRGRGKGKSYPKLGGRHAHRVMAEKMLGRPLIPGEVVHHKDHNKTNWDPSNLEVFPSQAEHARHHVKNRTCNVPDCDRKHEGRGLCKLHRQRMQRHGDLESHARTRPSCTVEGCGRPHVAKGLCNVHYLRERTTREGGSHASPRKRP